MGVEPVRSAEVFGIGGKQRIRGQSRDTRVFHAARDKIGHADIVVFGPGILHPDFLLQKGENRRRISEGVCRFGKLRRRREKSERQIAMSRLQFVEVAPDDRD